MAKSNMCVVCDKPTSINRNGVVFCKGCPNRVHVRCVTNSALFNCAHLKRNLRNYMQKTNRMARDRHCETYYSTTPQNQLSFRSKVRNSRQKTLKSYEKNMICSQSQLQTARLLVSNKDLTLNMYRERNWLLKQVNDVIKLRYELLEAQMRKQQVKSQSVEVNTNKLTLDFREVPCQKGCIKRNRDEHGPYGSCQRSIDRSWWFEGSSDQTRAKHNFDLESSH